MSDKAAASAKSATARSGNVQSVDRAMALLEALGEDEDGCRLSDLVARTGLSPSTAYRLLTTLEKRCFVQLDPAEGMWHIGRQAFSVGSAFARQRIFLAPCLPFLRRLRDHTHETANLAIVDGDDEMIVLTQVESTEFVHATVRVGSRAPMALSGMGKAILATYSPPAVAAIINRHNIDAATLLADLEAIRRRGYSVDDEEYLTGLRCVAAVVYNTKSEALCAIAVLGLAARFTPERVMDLGALVQNTARELTLALGGKLPMQNEP